MFGFKIFILSFYCVGIVLSKNTAPPIPKPAATAPAPGPASSPTLGPASSPTPAVATPPAAQCGYSSSAFNCIGNPHIIKPDVAKKCDRSTTDCDKMKCIFKKSGWMKNNIIDEDALKTYLTQYARDNPDWTEATAYIKEQCLGKNLGPQGIYLDCPTYDFIHCALTAFIRKAKPAQWPATPQCDQGKLYASSCPVCPDSCFAPAIPIGSCKACLDWPKKL